MVHLELLMEVLGLQDLVVHLEMMQQVLDLVDQLDLADIQH